MASPLEVAIKLVMDSSEAEKGISNVSKMFKSGLGAAAKAGAAAVGAAAAAVVAVGKQAVSAYAEYEQLVGGVETLFKDSAGTVETYASNAYKTAGLSANEYMETVTSFSASLLQSLGGDTEAAAKYADMAITDMADNANKMGSDMSSIQAAYQGFAKQNYTMLDNLKLGYGGTKSEMERLILDAEKLDSTFSATRDENGELAMSYADIVDAIHIVQTEMGITGTTAKEASTTIQGSINSAKAAWQNWLTGLADENADLEKLTDELFESIITVAENLLPVIERVLENIGKSLQTKLPELLRNGIAYIVEHIPEIITLGLQLVEAIIQGIGQGMAVLYSMVAPWVDENIVQPFMERINNFKEQWNQAWTDAKDFVVNIFESIRSTIEEKINAAKEAVHNAIEKVKAIFDFHWEFPHLALPHFSISGSFSLNPPSVPHLSVEWYKQGGIMTDPTLFGFNPFTGKAMIGGEAGAEAIAPIETLQGYVSDAVKNGQSNALSEIAEILRGMANGRIPITVDMDITTEIDGATLARKTYKFNLAEANMHGQSLIIGAQ